MWIDNDVYRNDLEGIINDRCIPWDTLDGKNILITGATGLIGSAIVNTLLYYGTKHNNAPAVYALVRNLDKAKRIFEKQMAACDGQLRFVHADILDQFAINENIDYVIHTASQTNSKEFVNHPVETIETAYKGTYNLLKLAKSKNCTNFVYLSSMEVYGNPENDNKITEESPTNLNTMAVRSSYPESKRLCECLCKSFGTEYNLNTCVVRLTQTFGPGVCYNDSRVFAEFARCAIESKDIILHTLGQTKRNYVYTADAVRAILLILLRGCPGEAYNVANEETYCTIYDMAKLVSEKIAMSRIDVKCEVEKNIQKYGYALPLKMNLSADKLKSLGWLATTNLLDMFKNMISTMEEKE